MADFPRRMRDWLFNVMRDLADRRELTPHFLQMEKEAESNMTRRWTNAAIWKFCDLDGHPPDRYNIYWTLSIFFWVIRIICFFFSFTGTFLVTNCSQSVPL